MTRLGLGTCANKKDWIYLRRRVGVVKIGFRKMIVRRVINTVWIFDSV